MALISCPECGRPISEKAKSCPLCGFPISKNRLRNQLSNKTKAAASVVSNSLKDPLETADIGELLKDITPLPEHFSPGTTFNGIGTSMGGYTEIPGIAGIGLARKYFCFLHIPLIPLGLYVVRNWDGDSGKFLGKINSSMAAKYVNIRKHSILTFFEGIFNFIICLLLGIAAALIFSMISGT